MFRTEYLVTFETKDTFCANSSSFINLIEAIDGLTISSNQLRYKAITAQFDVQSGEIAGEKQRFFHLKISSVPEDQLETFEELQRSIKSILSKIAGKPPQILWDGVGTAYAILAYPKIHDLENLLRKLITKFMLTTVGVAWTSEAIPKEVAESVRIKDGKSDQNYLFQVDFIQLSNFLFKEYPTLGPLPLLERLRKAEKLADLDLSELKQALPRSNWDRYFSTLVNCESDYLRVRWERLYERRNQVAHNRPMNKGEFEECLTLCEELTPKLQQAIDSLDRVTISEDDRERVSESAAASKSLKAQEYIQEWNHFHELLYELVLASSNGEDAREKVRLNARSFRTLLNHVSKGLKSPLKKSRKKILELFILRNMLLHRADISVPDDKLQELLRELRAFGARVQNLTADKLGKSEATDELIAESITAEDFSEGEDGQSGDELSDLEDTASATSY